MLLQARNRYDFGSAKRIQEELVPVLLLFVETNKRLFRQTRKIHWEVGLKQFLKEIENHPKIDTSEPPEPPPLLSLASNVLSSILQNVFFSEMAPADPPEEKTARVNLRETPTKRKGGHNGPVHV